MRQKRGGCGLVHGAPPGGALDLGGPVAWSRMQPEGASELGGALGLGGLDLGAQWGILQAEAGAHKCFVSPGDGAKVAFGVLGFWFRCSQGFFGLKTTLITLNFVCS